jgi:hypothetical protein
VTIGSNGKMSSMSGGAYNAGPSTLNAMLRPLCCDDFPKKTRLRRCLKAVTDALCRDYGLGWKMNPFSPLSIGPRI